MLSLYGFGMEIYPGSHELLRIYRDSIRSRLILKDQKEMDSSPVR